MTEEERQMHDDIMKHMAKIHKVPYDLLVAPYVPRYDPILDIFKDIDIETILKKEIR